MLKFYRADIQELLENRDIKVSKLKDKSDKEIFKNRDYYELSTRPINLLKELK